ncbi:Transferase [Mactra antiquata]
MRARQRRWRHETEVLSFIIKVGLYCSLVVTGYLIGAVFQNDPNVSIYNKIDVSANGDWIQINKGDEEKPSNSPSVLCWIATAPQFLQNRASHVKSTWGKRCDKTLYFSSVTNTTFGAVGLNVTEGREHLTAKSQEAFRHIYNNYFNDYDWFLKADDNTYVIVENLKYFLSGKDKNEPIYFGHHFQSIIEGGYTSGGAGYVLSKEALRRLAEKGDDKILCRQDGGAEDVEIGTCLHNLGVTVGYSHDESGRSLFHCFDPISHLVGRYPEWYKKFDAAGAQKGKAYMGNDAISFHYVKPMDMYLFDYFLYHVKVH